MKSTMTVACTTCFFLACSDAAVRDILRPGAGYALATSRRWLPVSPPGTPAHPEGALK
jgi:hypothetical protein